MTVTVIRVIKYHGDEEAVRKAIQMSKPLGVHECNGYTLTIGEHLNELSQPVQLYDFMVEEALNKPTANEMEEANKQFIENQAKEIYLGWAKLDGYVPWVEGGNSTMQDKARALARAELGI